MHRIDTDGSESSLFVDRNPPTKAGTVVDAAWLNDLQENVCQFIEAAGGTLTKGESSDLLLALTKFLDMYGSKNYMSGFEMTALTMDNPPDTNYFLIGAGDCSYKGSGYLAHENISYGGGSKGLKLSTAYQFGSGDDKNGLPSNLTLTQNTWYHVFVFIGYNGSQWAVDIGFDTDLQMANLISHIGAEYVGSFRRIGSIHIDHLNASNWGIMTQMRQHGDLFTLSTPKMVYDVSIASGAPDTHFHAFCPSGVPVRPILTVRYPGNSNSCFGIMTGSEQGVGSPSLTVAPLFHFGTDGAININYQGSDFITLDQTINYSLSGTGPWTSGVMKVVCSGWVDIRGRG
jgi:hypothetical protein